MTAIRQSTAARRAVVHADDGFGSRAHVPEPREGSVSRTAIVNRLRTHQEPVVLVTAPAGYGKTTVLSQWARRDGRRFVWLTVERDDDAFSLAQLLVSSLGDDASDAVEALARGPRAFARRIGALMLANHERLVIALDRVEELTDARALAVVAALAENLPPQTQLVLAGRRAPALAFGRLRAEGRLLELGAADLKLTERESGMLLQSMGVDVDATELEDLQDRTEGWPVGLATCGLVLQLRPGRKRRDPASFNGAHRYVAQYLHDEVLALLPPDLFKFATHASLLDRMSGPLCDSVLECHDSAGQLAELADSESFVFALDRERSWFRFHTLVRDALLARLTQHEPARYLELRRRAAEWYAQNGEVPTALRHLRAVGDRDRAAALLGTMLPALCTHGASSLTETLDDRWSEELLHEHQSAAVVGALAHAMVGRVVASEHWAAAAERGRVEHALVDGTESSAAWVATMRAALCHDGVEQMRRDATLALKRLNRQSPIVPFALLLLGVSHVLSGENAAAEAALLEASELAGTDAPLVTCAALAELSLLAQNGEDWLRAEELARAARDAAEPLDANGNVFAALAHAASARSALRNSNWVRAGDDIHSAYRLLPRANEAMAWLSIQVRVELTRAHLALNDVGAAAELATEIDHLLLARPHLETAAVTARELRARVDAVRKGERTASMLTGAELRLLPLLTTHLTFRQIAQHLYVSRNTIKTQAISVYRKLGVSSRTEAIDRAVELGLLKHDGEMVLEHLE